MIERNLTNLTKRAGQAQSPTSDEFLTPAELRARWAVSNMFLWRARRDGKLPAIKLGRHVRFRIADVERIETESATH